MESPMNPYDPHTRANQLERMQLMSSLGVGPTRSLDARLWPLQKAAQAADIPLAEALLYVVLFYAMTVCPEEGEAAQGAQQGGGISEGA